MFVKVYLVSNCVCGEKDPIPLSDSKHTLTPCPEYGFGLVNCSQIMSVYPFDGDFKSDRCLINTNELTSDGYKCVEYVSDDFQKLLNHFFLEF